MKKYIVSFVLATAVLSWQQAKAQSETDAFRLSQTTPLSGTARFQAMGGAFASLGGDPSSITQNPAGLGVYRKSELSISLEQVKHTNNINWYNNTEQKKASNFYSPNFSAIAFYFDKYSGSGMTFGFNRQNLVRYNRSFKISSGTPVDYSVADYAALITPDNAKPDDLLPRTGYNPYQWSNYSWLSILAYEAGWIKQEDGIYQTVFFYPNKNNQYVPYGPAEAHMNWRERGSVEAYDFTFGFNYKDLSYFGFSLRYTDVDYALASTYTEDFMDDDYLVLGNELWTKGGGFAFSLGTIMRPVGGLRIGLAYFSPTWMVLQDGFYASSTSRYSHAVDDSGNPFPKEKWILKGQTPKDATSSYRLTTPSRFVVGLGYTFDNKGLISFDYELTPYNSMRLRNLQSTSYFSVDNEAIDNHYTLSQTMRVGVEYKPLSKLSLRLGSVLTTTPMKKRDGLTSFEKNTTPILTAGTLPHYMIPTGSLTFTGGIGYKMSRSFYIDLAFVNSNTINHVYSFPTLSDSKGNPIEDFTSPESIRLSENTFKTVVTLGYKF